MLWSEFFNETLIVLLLLFDVGEQLLTRKKKLFYFSKLPMLHNDLFLHYRQVFGPFWAYFCLFLLSTTQNKVFKK